MHRGPDVPDEILHALRGVALLEAVLDGVAVARRARTPERQEPDPQPLLEQRLLHVVVPARPAQLHDDLLPQVLMARLLLHDLLDHAAVGNEGAPFVFLELPETAPVVEELRHRQLEPALRERHRLARQPLPHARLHLFPRELPVHLRHRLVVLGLLLDVPDHELHPLLGHEAQPVAEHVGGGQLPVGLALHELHDHAAVLRAHLVLAEHVAHARCSFRSSRAMRSFWISLVPS